MVNAIGPLSISWLIYLVVDVRSHSVTENKLRTPVMESTPSLTAADDLSNIFWFIQVMCRLLHLTFKVSDLHISVFDEITRITDFQNFCENNIRIIRPELLLISGDLTDAKTSNKHASLQVRSEWEIYASILRKTNLLNITHWLDIRGNHGLYTTAIFSSYLDSFNVPRLIDGVNYFRKYGARGQLNTLSYLFTLHKPYGNYSFIALDACPDPGLSRPLNFFGVLTQDTERALRRFIEVTKNDNHTFWFGHYPTSTIVPSSLIRSLISSGGFAYLCGHLHTWLGWAPEMYALQPHGFMELELGDWRDNRRYRILAVDHDLVSFVDVQFHATNTSTEWPVVLITNPKHANFLLPHKEPVNRIAHSTHIRILAWSKWPVVQVSVSVDDIHLGNAIKSRVVDWNTSAPNPLYVLPWDPNIWNTHSVHTIQVTVQDSVGNFRVVTQPFIVRGTPPWNFSFLSSFLLSNDHTFNLRAAFYGLWFLLIGTLILPRILNRISIRRILCRTCLGTGVYRLSNCDNLMYPIAFYLVYVVGGKHTLIFIR
ncbi:Transmembrane protein 62 [Paragonimus kellicotti]|nr:Transmembrane protein 62 [Paragonimus kellicotti]